MSSLKDKIWITAKTRMVAEKRYKIYEISSHLFLSYMSLLMILSTIFSAELRGTVHHFDQITLCISLSIFAASLISYGFRFGETAAQFRECYLRLQELEHQALSEAETAKRYFEILGSCPNHSTADYGRFVVEMTFLTNKSIKSGPDTISWTGVMLITTMLRVVLFHILVIGIPLASTFLIVWPAFN